MFSKNEKKLRQEFSKRSIRLCKDTVKDIGELYEDLSDSYHDIEDVISSFNTFAGEIAQKLEKSEVEKMESLLLQLQKLDKCARNAVRDVHDLLRAQKKRLKEALEEA